MNSKHHQHWLCVLAVLFLIDGCGASSPTSENSIMPPLDGYVAGKIVMAYRYPEFSLSGTVYLESSGFCDTSDCSVSEGFTFNDTPRQPFTLRASSPYVRTFEEGFNFGSDDTLEIVIESEIRQGNDPGYVDVMVPDTTSIAHLVSLLSSLGIELGWAYGFSYQSTIEITEIDSVENILDSKEYIRDAFISATDSGVHISCQFLDMSEHDLEDWLSSSSPFGLNMIPNANKGGLIKTEIGEERFWAVELRQYPIFTFIWLLYQPIP